MGNGSVNAYRRAGCEWIRLASQIPLAQLDAGVEGDLRPVDGARHFHGYPLARPGRRTGSRRTCLRPVDAHRPGGRRAGLAIHAAHQYRTQALADVRADYLELG